MRENRESFYDLFLCSRRSRCSRFMFLKRSVRCNFHRETRENRESSSDLLLLVRVVRVVRGSSF